MKVLCFVWHTLCQVFFLFFFVFFFLFLLLFFVYRGREICDEVIQLDYGTSVVLFSEVFPHQWKLKKLPSYDLNISVHSPIRHYAYWNIGILSFHLFPLHKASCLLENVKTKLLTNNKQNELVKIIGNVYDY